MKKRIMNGVVSCLGLCLGGMGLGFLLNAQKAPDISQLAFVLASVGILGSSYAHLKLSTRWLGVPCSYLSLFFFILGTYSHATFRGMHYGFFFLFITFCSIVSGKESSPEDTKENCEQEPESVG